MSRIWNEELREHGVRVVAFDPGDMDTPLHALAVPDADPATLKKPAEPFWKSARRSSKAVKTILKRVLVPRTRSTPG